MIGFKFHKSTIYTISINGSIFTAMPVQFDFTSSVNCKKDNRLNRKATLMAGRRLEKGKQKGARLIPCPFCDELALA